MSARGDLVANLLAGIGDRAFPPPPTGNESLNNFSVPLDAIALSDLVSAANERRPFVYGGSSLYAESLYASRVALTMSGNEVTDAERLFALTWGLGQNGGSTDGATPPGGVGIWESGTNLFRRGQCDATTDWGATDGGVTIATDATTTAPFSPQAVKVTTNGGAANQGVVCTSATGQAAGAATNGVGSIRVKGVNGASYRVLMEWGNSDASTTDGAVTTFTATGAWQEIDPTALAVAAGKTGDSLRIIVTVNGTRAESFWVAHAMLQTGVSVVSPYVATSGGTTASRPAALVQAPVSLLDATQMWVAFRMRMGYTSAIVRESTPLTWYRSGTNNQLQLYIYSNPNWPFGGAGGGIAFGSFVSGGFDRAVVAGTNADFASPGSVMTIIGAVTASQVKTSVNGAPFVTVARSAFPDMTGASLCDIGSYEGTQNEVDSAVLWFAFGTGTLSDADAATINGFGNTPPDLSQLPNASVPTMVWPGVSDFAFAGP